MRFLLDENVPTAVARVLSSEGHTVDNLRDHAAAGAADPIVATIAEALNAILVSFDGDFRQIAPRIPDGQRRRFRKLRPNMDAVQ